MQGGDRRLLFLAQHRVDLGKRIAKDKR